MIDLARKKVYGYWDCEYCGKKGIRGDHRECTGCGQPRSAGVHFYIKDPGKPELIEQENFHKFSGKADWVCSYCNALNSANNESCSGCGAGKEDSEKNYFTSHSPTDTYDKKTGKWSEGTGRAESKQQEGLFKRIVRSKIFIILSVIFGIFLFLMIINAKTFVEIEVQSLEWESSVYVEESYESFESDWYLPSDARLAYTRQEEYTYWVNGMRRDSFRPDRMQSGQQAAALCSEQIRSAYEPMPLVIRDENNTAIGLHDSDIHQRELMPLDFYDNGDGSFDWDDDDDDSWDFGDDDDDSGYWVTEYRTKYYYYITRWRDAHTYTKNGTKEEGFSYAEDISLASNERVSGRSATYFVNVSGDSEIKRYTAEEDVWSQMEKGGRYSVEVGVFVDKDKISRIFEDK